METLHLIELDWIFALQQWRGPFLDQFFLLLNFLDTTPFYYFFIPLIWFGYNRDTGAKLLYFMLFGTLLNHDLKELFQQPRPFHLVPELAVISVKGYGLPSGGAQVACMLFAFLALTWKKKWITISTIFLILLIGLSRVYLGVHFISDVLAGWIIGGALLFVYWKSLPAIEHFLSSCSQKTLVFLSLIVPLLLLLLNVSNKTVIQASIAIGASIGLIFAEPERKRGPFFKIFRIFLAIFGIFIFTQLQSLIHLQSFFVIGLEYSLMGFWIAFGVDTVTRSWKK